MDEEDEDSIQQHFICVEQELILETSNILAAIFFCIAAHYIFNLEYNKYYYKDAAMFIQEFIFELPECDTRLKKQSYLTVVTELKNLMSADS